MNKNEAMWEYLMKCPEINTYLTFNSVGAESGNTGLLTEYSSEAWEKKMLRGGIKRYDFAVIMMKQHDTGTSTVNISQIFDVQKVMDWIDEQNQIRNFPDFGNKMMISIENLQNMPNLAGVSDDSTVAKYMIQCRVKYYD